MNISVDPIGPFLSYRLLYPGFEAYTNLSIKQRCLENFKVHSLIENSIIENNCINCHTFNPDNQSDFFFHARGSFGGTYFCRAIKPDSKLEYKNIKYNLYRISFNKENRTFGTIELIFDALALDKSVSFPRISPNGKYLIFTLQDYGCFSIWHKNADLYSINLETCVVSRLDLNSDLYESYHSWSSNSKWLVFSNKREDGLTARPYISYIQKNGDSCKPFVLPQKGPTFYDTFLKTFNIPENCINTRQNTEYCKIRGCSN